MSDGTLETTFSLISLNPFDLSLKQLFFRLGIESLALRQVEYSMLRLNFQAQI
ncbi:hypothetical protein [Sphingobium sp.]|uniref:hypothetical protein n=1 Tax=Sphingobium sp. TaxID=1912891 RepID=UPI0028BEE2B5|nr:hypothetical protein [Sphingobium sp.]